MRASDLKPTGKREGREEEAERVLGRTEFSAGARAVLIGGFLAGLLLVPGIQWAREWKTGEFSIRGLARVMPGWDRLKSVRSLARVWGLLPEARDLKEAERELERRSWFSGGMRPQVQTGFTKLLRWGGEQAYLGKNGWLFYRPDVESVWGAPFLSPGQIAHRKKSGVQPDPVRGIVDFREQLKRRGIELVVVPVPVKPCIEGRHLTGKPGGTLLQNASHGEFVARLEAAGVRVFDPAPGLEQDARELGVAYLETDTHWRPETMERVAARLADVLNQVPGLRSGGIQPGFAEGEVEGMGDIVGLLGLGENQTLYGRQKVRIRQVTLGNGLLRPDPGAEVLVLGDSFSNIYSLEGMGWGEGAGFVEHLGAALGVRVDAVVRNSDGAFGSREILQRELAAGRDRLAGKKVVVWEFASRELALGDWKVLEMRVGAPVQGRFLALKAGEECTVEGTVGAVSAVPRPGTVPYSEHVVSVHVRDLRRASAGSGDGTGAGTEDALVYLWSMQGQKWTPAARLRTGDRVRLRLQAWESVSGRYEKVNRSELTDGGLVAEEPVWGELLGLGETVR
jgi:hypothetical protein